MEPPRFDVFLSHNSRDKAAVERLAVKLKSAGLEPWLDKWCLTPGGRWQDELVAGLRACSACAVFVGPNGLGDWVHEELGVALDRAAKDRSFRLFLVLLPGLPEPFDATTLPPFLSTRTWVDLRPGVEDSRAFQHLVNAIKGVPFGQQIPTEPNNDVCPYRGLQTFDEEHAEFFFGRENDLQRLAEKLKGTHFLAVLGPSGSGKSSLVRAGLIPALRRGVLPGSHDWTVCVFTPGSHPLTNLAAQLLRLHGQAGMQRTLDEMAADARTLHLAVALALADRPAGERLVWVVDQFEETFTLCQDEHERAQFLANLLYAASVPDGRSIVLLTLRADFYPKCAAYPDLSARISAQQFLVSPLTLDGLHRAIEEPAWHVGLEFEDGLVDTILEDVTSQPGALPLLEHALLELWERRRGKMLTLEAYRQSGGVQGAIAKRADAIYSRFSPEEQTIARRTLLRLTQPGEGTEDTRRRASLDELGTHSSIGTEVDAVVRALVDARLLTTSEDEPTHEHTIEVSHEALIRGWPRLRSWIDEDRSGLRVQRRLTEAAHEWQRMDRDESMLYRGARLATAVEWSALHEDALNDLEREFLEAGTALKQREEQQELARRQHELEAAQRLAAAETQRAEAAAALVRSERRRLRIARLLTAGLSVVLVFAIVTAGVAFDQRSQAQTAQQQAETQRAAAVAAEAAAVAAGKTATSRELAANSVAQLQQDPQLSLLLARSAVQTAPTSEAMDALRQALSQSHLRMVLLGHKGEVVSASFSPDGSEILSAGADGTARLWDAHTGRQIAKMSGKPGLTAARFSPNGRVVVSFGAEGTARLWDARTGKLLAVLVGHKGLVFDAEFSADSHYLVTAGYDGKARVWAVPSGHLLFSFNGLGGPIPQASFSPDGSTIATASADGTARLWNAHNGTLIAALTGATDVVWSARFSPDGSTVVTASADGSARLYDARTGVLRTTIKGTIIGGQPELPLQLAAFSYDGSTLMTAGNGTSLHQALLYYAATGAPRTALMVHTAQITSAAFSHDDRLVVTASADGTAKVWVTGWLNTAVTLRGQSGTVEDATFSPDDSEIVTAGQDGSVDVWDTGVGRIFATVPSGITACGSEPKLQNFVTNAAISHDQKYLVVTSDDCTARVWSMQTDRLVATLTGHTDQVWGVAFSPDDRWLVTSGADDTARVWDTRDWHTVVILRGHTNIVWNAAFSPDGRYLATASSDGTVRLWDTGTWRTIRVMKLPASSPGRLWGPVFSPNGRWLATPSNNDTQLGTVIWNVQTGALVTTLRGHTAVVNSAAFSPDGRELVTVGGDSLGIVWSTSTWQRVATLTGAQGALETVAFSPDGQWVATGGDDQNVNLWEVGSWRDLAALPGAGAVVQTVLFSPDDQSIISASWDNAVRIYPCDVCGPENALLARAAAQSARDYTPAERKLYLHEQ
jgi:WD40 repeat protein